MSGLYRQTRLWVSVLSLGLLAAPLTECRAGNGELQGPVVRVEEDWQLQISEPHSPDMSPQISTYMWALEGHPTAFSVHLNHAPVGVFAIGGVQTIATVNDSVVAMQSSGPQAPLETSGEQIAWTQVLEVKEGKLSFGLKTLTSWTWGNLGFGDTAISVSAGGLDNLDGYSPVRSHVASGVGYGANRVNKMQLIEVRFYDADGNVRTLSRSGSSDGFAVAQ